MTLDIDRPPAETLTAHLLPDDRGIPEITLDLGEQDELRRVQLTAMTAHMLRRAIRDLRALRAALEAATLTIQTVTDQTTIGEAIAIKERYRICRSKYLTKRNREQKKLAEQSAQLLARITAHGISDDLSLAILEGIERKIIRQMILTKLIDNDIRSTFKMKFGSRVCPRCKGQVSVGHTAIYEDDTDQFGPKSISHASCYGAALILDRAG